tara:strand:- start:312 stop:869 length:558 start_codon:yes stop_codon:yes gene_type:complete
MLSISKTINNNIRIIDKDLFAKITIPVSRALKLNNLRMFRPYILNNYPKHLDDCLGKLLCHMKIIGDNTYLQFLNNFSDGLYCSFTLEVSPSKKGIYMILLSDEVVYIGRTIKSFRTRINNGYGRLSPMQTLRRRGATNCRINKELSRVDGIVQWQFINMTCDEEIIKTEVKMIKSLKPKWNIKI